MIFFLIKGSWSVSYKQYELPQFLNLQNFLLQVSFLRKYNNFVLPPSCVSFRASPFPAPGENFHKMLFEHSVIRGKPRFLILTFVHSITKIWRAQKAYGERH